MTNKEALIGKVAEAMADLIIGAVANERERCAKVAEAEAARYEAGGPMSSMAEDRWGSVAAIEIASLIRGKGPL